MPKRFVVLIVLVGLAATASADDVRKPTYASTYDELVDRDRNITLPKDFLTEWVFLGTWSVAATDVERSSEASGHGAAGLRNVYTQPGVVESYLNHKSFPDGAMLIKELLKGVTAPMTTGTVSRAGELEGWFVMIKDTEGHFERNPLWCDGWGWVLFNADKPMEPATKNFRAECTGCHIPAQKNDWVYVEGYPLLQSQAEQ